jgi:hypothetical protein
MSTLNRFGYITPNE